jgi:hypothetical protein
MYLNKEHGHVHKIFVALAAAAVTAIAVAPQTAAASEETDVMAAVFQWVDGFNKGDMKAAVAACAAETSIIDNIPPHEWHGAGPAPSGRLTSAPTLTGMASLIGRLLLANRGTLRSPTTEPTLSCLPLTWARNTANP